MSANNIVVIKAEDGKFRGYHRDMDAYSEGQYDYEGPCQFCNDGCDFCDGKGHYTPLESVPIFEVDTIEDAIHAYNKWCQESGFIVEYGFIFEGLTAPQPNAEDIELLEFIRNQVKQPGDRCWCYDCPGAYDVVGKPRIDCQVCDGSGSVPEEWFRREFEKEKKIKIGITDTELLDFLQTLTNRAEYTGKVACRDSTTGRGWRLHESGHCDAVLDVRQAIINYMKVKRIE